MRVLVAGANGQVGHHAVRLLAEAGHKVRAMIRDEAQSSDLEALGGEPVVADLEGEVAHTVEGCDAIIFSAGGGPGSGGQTSPAANFVADAADNLPFTGLGLVLLLGAGLVLLAGGALGRRAVTA